MRSACIGWNDSGSTVTVPGKTTSDLQTPTGYTGIYANWNLDLDGDDRPDRPWRFGSDTQYPTLRHQRFQRPPKPDQPPYDPAADHPEIYTNDRYGISASCQRFKDDDEPWRRWTVITFNLGRYERYVLLHLSLWNGEFFMSYESFDLPQPPLIRNGQSATVRITTNPAQTRFLLNSGAPTTNLVLGYADCHTDDNGEPFPPS